MAEAVQHPTVLDSTQQHLGKVYAQALLGAAVKAGLVEQVLEEFAAFQSQVLDALPHFESILASPRVALEDKLNILDSSLRGQVSEVFLNFLRVVLRHRRFDCVRAIHRALIGLHDQLSGRMDVQVTSAAPLTPEQQEQVARRLESSFGRQVRLRVQVDPDLIGGMLVRVGDTVYDGSLAGRLARLRNVAVEKTSQAVSDSFARFESKEL